jgi:hypothetical protein
MIWVPNPRKRQETNQKDNSARLVWSGSGRSFFEPFGEPNVRWGTLKVNNTLVTSLSCTFNLTVYFLAINSEETRGRARPPLLLHVPGIPA